MDSKTRDLRKILIHVNKNSRFYRKRFKQYGIDPKKIKSIQDFQEIPFTTREDLAKNNPYDFLCVPESEVDFVRFSSGTSNDGIVTNLKTKKEVSGTYGAYKKGLKMLILTQPDRIPYLNYREKKFGHVPVPGNLYNLPGSALIASEFKIEAISTTPTIALLFSKYLERFYNLKKIKLLFLSAENLSSLKLKLLKKKYPNAKIQDVYSLVEVSGVGLSCSRENARDTGIFHTNSRLFYEIINPDTNKPCKFGERGDLVVTNLKNIAMPLIRYRTGDMVQLLKNNCKCRFLGPLLRVFGRAKFDMVKVAGAELNANDIEKAVYSLGSYLTGDFQAHVYERLIGGEIKPKIRVDVVLKGFLRNRKEAVRKNIENRMAENIRLSPRFTLKQAIENKIFLPLEVNFVDEIPRTHKTKRVVDHRI